MRMQESQLSHLIGNIENALQGLYQWLVWLWWMKYAHASFQEWNNCLIGSRMVSNVAGPIQVVGFHALLPQTLKLLRLLWINSKIGQPVILTIANNHVTSIIISTIPGHAVRGMKESIVRSNPSKVPSGVGSIGLVVLINPGCPIAIGQVNIRRVRLTCKPGWLEFGFGRVCVERNRRFILIGPDYFSIWCGLGQVLIIVGVIQIRRGRGTFAIFVCIFFLHGRQSMWNARTKGRPRTQQFGWLTVFPSLPLQ
mmetsp:Transcript_40305/g.97332  ORF Transcript_40305/g.97332 Transcript_40305/m.97332 type:complete len:253 (-) Transcript_40305:481-1239(-)